MNSFKLKVYNRRRDSDITFKFEFTESGWYISNNAINGNCEPDGRPLVYTNFNNENINYPNNFGRFLAYIWEQISTGVIDSIKAEVMFQELANWVSRCEESTPKWSGYNL